MLSILDLQEIIKVHNLAHSIKFFCKRWTGGLTCDNLRTDRYDHGMMGVSGGRREEIYCRRGTHRRGQDESGPDVGCRVGGGDAP